MPRESTTATLIVTEPVYRQMARLCRQLLSDGTYKPGDKYPSERELAEKYKVSRATANKVISNMVAEGLLQFRPGVGTFVLEPARGLHNSLREMESFTDRVRELGLEPETRVMAFERMVAGDLELRIREGLGLGEGEDEVPVIYFRRLRLASGEPVILEDRWVLASLMPGLRAAQLRGSFYQLLESGYGVKLGGERHRIRARKLAEDEAALLGVAEGDAGLVVEGPGFAAGGGTIWYEVLLHRGDRYELVNEVRGGGRASDTVVQLLARPTDVQSQESSS